MITKTRVALTAAVAAVLVALPTAAQAADFERYSTTGRSYISFDSASRAVNLCDRVSGDGVGAYVSINNSYAYIGYNNCGLSWLSERGYTTIEVCDWMVNKNGAR